MIDYEKLSKDCSYILRHAADDYFLTSDSQGWVDLKEFINVLNLCFGWNTLNELDINVMIAQSKKNDMKLLTEEYEQCMVIQLSKKLYMKNVSHPHFYIMEQKKKILSLFLNTA